MYDMKVDRERGVIIFYTPSAMHDSIGRIASLLQWNDIAVKIPLIANVGYMKTEM